MNYCNNKCCNIPSCITGQTGVEGLQGPTGPQGVQGLQGPKGKPGPIGPQGIQGPKGDIGPAGAQGIQGPKGDVGPTGPQGPQGSQGPAGRADTIKIGNTVSTSSEEEAMVIDVGIGTEHVLDFYIPSGRDGNPGPQGLKGETGDVGPAGPIGPQGPKGDVGPTGPAGEASPASYSAVAFFNFFPASASQIIDIKENTLIPSNSDYFSISEEKYINVKKKGTYEIFLSGKILGATLSNGGSFALINKDNNNIIGDLSFILFAGNEANMNFAKVILIEFDSPINLAIKCNLIGDETTSKIEFSDIDLLIKKYN